MAYEGSQSRQGERKRLRFERVLCPEAALTFAIGDATSDIATWWGPTVGHMKRTRDLAGRVAAALGLGADEIRVVRCGAALHDIGKLVVPGSILDKAGELNALEWEIVRRHPETGARMLSGIAGFGRVRAAVAAHHERPDGRGYPAGLVSPDIPLEARLISVADAYDAMTSDRPYRRALGHGRAVEQLDAGAGSQFDPEVVEATKAVLRGGTRDHTAAAGPRPRR